MWDGASDSSTSLGCAPCIEEEEKPKDCQASQSASEKIQRKLAQNRQAAKKCRMRKKAYVQELEMDWMKLAHLELELKRVRQNGMTVPVSTSNTCLMYRTVSSGASAFEIAFGQWKDGRDRAVSDLRNVLESSRSEAELHLVIDNMLEHYQHLFQMKRDAARIDAFYVVSGMWATSVERFFLWIGGFRPSELLSFVKPHLEPLTEQQTTNVSNLKRSCTQAEDALSQGVERLQQTMVDSIAFLAEEAGSYSSQTASALDKMESLEGFVNQADHLREQTLRHMSRILSAHQTARGLLAFHDYFHYLRALSELWTARCPQEPQ